MTSYKNRRHFDYIISTSTILITSCRPPKKKVCGEHWEGVQFLTVFLTYLLFPLLLSKLNSFFLSSFAQFIQSQRLVLIHMEVTFVLVRACHSCCTIIEYKKIQEFTYIGLHFNTVLQITMHHVVFSVNRKHVGWHQTYQVSRIRRETHAFGLCLTLTRTATIFSRIGARLGKK